LKAIAAALEVPMFKFFQSESISEDLIVRNGHYIHLGSIEDGVIYELLTPDLNGSIEFCRMEVPPHSKSAREEKSHTGEEVAFVMEGRVKIHLNKRIFELNEGDSVRIPAGVKHLWENTDSTAAVIIFAITPPSF
jgi:quercetin dioxygenase-like cupin family protein